MASCIPFPPTHPTKPVWLSTPSYTHLLTHHPALLYLLHSCRSPRHLQQIHAHLVASGLAHRPYPLTTLLELSSISDSRDLDYALQIFRTLDTPTIFSYNTIIRAFSTSKTPQISTHFFLQMLHRGLVPNKYTYPFVLKSLSSSHRSSIPGELLHGHIIKLGLCSDPFVDSSLIHFYSNRGELDDARKLFDRIPHRNVVCWSAMVSGCVQWGRFKEALELFNGFQREGLLPNESILVSILCAAAHLGALQQGRWIHAYIKRKDINLSIKLGTALINMYCRCGVVEEASEVFGSMDGRNVLSWTALISGMAMNGMSQLALDAFDEMVKTAVRPDSVTFVGVLMACSYAGLVNDGRKHFDDMRIVYELMPNIEHYGCMVDLLGRAGLLNEALDLIRSMPMTADTITWSALLNACRVHKDVKMGEFIGRLLIESDPLNDANYVLLANIYSQAGRWDNAVEVRRLMKDRRVRKCPGCSVIEVDGVVHEFFAGDESDPRFVELKPMLVEMGERLRLAGYVPNTSSVLLDVDEEEKRRALCYHSEKLAIAFGLINVQLAMPIRVVKNLRACEDCHSATKLISKAFGREIVVRDRQRFHHFKDGVCSCSDYW